MRNLHRKRWYTFRRKRLEECPEELLEDLIEELLEDLLEKLPEEFQLEVLKIIEAHFYRDFPPIYTGIPLNNPTETSQKVPSKIS